MVEKLQVYKCSVCGNMVMVVHVGKGTLVCCGQPMKLLAENTEDAATEKHVPEVSSGDGKVRVVVGSVKHPMDANHYIEWIQLVAGDRSELVFLSPGQDPSAVFSEPEGDYFARAYCNLHGLWRS